VEKKGEECGVVSGMTPELWAEVMSRLGRDWEGLNHNRGVLRKVVASRKKRNKKPGGNRKSVETKRAPNPSQKRGGNEGSSHVIGVKSQIARHSRTNGNGLPGECSERGMRNLRCIRSLKPRC